MKKLLFAVSALAALSLLVPSTGMAQYSNQLGLYTDQAGTTTGTDGTAPFTNVTAYVVLFNPYNTNLEQPITGVKGAEWALTPGAGVVVLSLDFPVSTINVGTTTDVIAGFATPVDASSGTVTVGTYTFLYTSATSDPVEFHVAPFSSASLPGHMAVLDFADEQVYPLHPSSGDYELPVFGINLSPVAVEPTTMDAVKALYR